MTEHAREVQNDHDEYVDFWVAHLDELHEPIDGYIITHDGETETVWMEVFMI